MVIIFARDETEYRDVGDDVLYVTYHTDINSGASGYLVKREVYLQCGCKNIGNPHPFNKPTWDGKWKFYHSLSNIEIAYNTKDYRQGEMGFTQC